MFDIRQVYLENTGHMLNTPDSELEERLARVRTLLKEKQLGAVMILNRCSEGYTAWLTGCPMPDVPFNRSGAYIIALDGTAIDVGSDTLVTEEFLKNYRKLDETVTVPATNPLFSPALGFYIPDIQQHLLPGEQARLGVVHLEDMPAVLYDFLHSGIANLELADLTREMALLKAQRTPFEQEYAAIAANNVCRVFSAMPFMLRPGRTEAQLVADIRERIYSLGAGGQDTSRMANVLLESRAPGAAPSSPVYPGRTLQLGDEVNVQLRAISYNDIYSAVGRLYVLGEPCAETVSMWNHVCKAQDILFDALLPGSTLEAAYAKLTDYCEKNQLRLSQTNPLYGLGYVIGEAPVLFTQSGRTPLQPGMVIAVSPSVSSLTGENFYCCTDTCLITANGAKRLTNLPREIVPVCWD